MGGAFSDVSGSLGRFSLDPRTKIFLLLAINGTVLSVNQWYVMAIATLISITLLLLSNKIKESLIFLIIYTGSLYLYINTIDTDIFVLNIVGGIITGIINRMGPGLLMGYYLLKTTSVSQLIASLERLKLPKELIVSFSVMLRFFPTIREEYSSINAAMKMRGVSLGNTKGNPLSLIEYRVIPLFISCVKIGEELSSSALTRGLGSPEIRTNICQIGFKAIDTVYFLGGIGLILALTVVKGGV